jgi:hypothetical protein
MLADRASGSLGRQYGVWLLAAVIPLNSLLLQWITSTIISVYYATALVFLSKGSAEEYKSEVRCSCLVFLFNIHSQTTSYFFVRITSHQFLSEVLIISPVIRQKAKRPRSSKLLYDWRSVSMSWCRTPFGTCGHILLPVGMLLSESCGLVSAGRPIWREDGSVICSAVTTWSESLRTRNHTLLSHLWIPQPDGPGSRIYIPQEQGGPVIPPSIGFSLRRLLRLAGLRWRYSNPPSTCKSRLTVCLGVEATLWTFDQILFPFQETIILTSVA